MSKLADNLRALADFVMNHPELDGVAYVSATTDKQGIMMLAWGCTKQERLAFAQKFPAANWRRVVMNSHIGWTCVEPASGITLELPMMEEMERIEGDLGPVKLPEKTADQADKLSGFLKSECAHPKVTRHFTGDESCDACGAWNP